METMGFRSLMRGNMTRNILPVIDVNSASVHGRRIDPILRP